MKAVKFAACCLLVFPLVGALFHPLEWWRSQTRIRQREQSSRATVVAILREGQELSRQGRFNDALHAFERMRDAANAAHIDGLAARAMGNIGGCEFALHRYQAAVRTLIQAAHAAKRAGDLSAASICNANIASLYSEMGDLDAAAEWTAASLKSLSADDRHDIEAKLLIQLASLRARQARWQEADDLFARGLDAADRKGDVELYANGFNRLGEEHLKQHDLAAAERPLIEAYRLRCLNHLPMDSSYRNLGLLRMGQGDLRSATVLLDRAVELSAHPGGPIPTWDVYHQRGRVRAAQGRLREALDDLRIAHRLAQGWRWNAPPGDTARIGAESWLAKVHSALVDVGNRLYLETRDPALPRETFEAAEENQAESLRALVARRRTDPATLPPDYWEAVARLQRAEVQALRSPDVPSLEAVVHARAELARRELEASDTTAPPSPGLLERVRAALDNDTALFAFSTGEASSWLWVLDRNGLAVYHLASRAELDRLVKQTSAAILNGDTSSGGELYRQMFGVVGERFKSKSRWLVALDTGLFEAPLAALRANGRYLVEQHVIQTIPGVAMWMEARAQAANRYAGRFVGVADAIYNTADPRLSPTSPQSPRALMLPRLVASGDEVQACASLWNGERVLLEGAHATREALQTELARDPAVVHLATHVLESSGPLAEGLIALSLTPRLENQLLPPQEIAGWRTHAGLVVMSGCHSAGAPAMPGTGLLGLTRAWLAAGARNVIASTWATPDESGAIFRALYRQLRDKPDGGSAAALRSAQLEMIRSADWRALPRYWGAYFAVGIE